MLFAPMSALALLGAASCGSEPPTSQDDLQALLHDEPLTQVSVGALTDVPSADGGVGTGTGGTTTSDGGMVAGGGGTTGSGTGVAGTTGSAGRPMTGVAGSIAGATGTGNVGGSIAGTTGMGNFGGGGAGGFGGGGAGGFGGGGAGPAFGTTLGTWPFDDCNTFRTNLSDQSFNGNTAFRSVSVACVEGIGGQAVAMANKDEDLVYVPDQPNFDFTPGVTVAGWFNHDAINNTRTLFRKRDDASSSAFALVLNNQKYEWVVKLGNKAVSIVSPKKAKLNEWTHVAASYDGFTLRLYLNGILVVAKGVTGTIVPAAGPFLMGNDGSKRLASGRMDQPFLANVALTDQEVMGLTCVRRLPTITGTPTVSAPTPSGTPAIFDVAITNQDSATCAPSDFFFQANASTFGVDVQPGFQFISQVPAATTSHLMMSATPSDDVDSGTFPIFLSLFDQRFGQFIASSVDLVVVTTGCRVSTARELMITNLGVVDDARATGSGAWSFKHLMEEMAPTAADAPAMVEDLIRSFLSPQTVNGFTVPPRQNMQFLVLDAWPRTPDGKLDLANAPLQLQAIVNRFDLRNLANGDAGEGRFVFAFQRPFAPPGVPLQATLIFEYKLPASTPEEILGWANDWHALGALTVGSPEYNTALQAITDRFNRRGARPSHVNGNAINAVRTNEIDFGTNGIWELREFVLSPSTGMLVPATVKLTPDLGFNRTDTLASFVNANEMSIIAETHDVPEQFQNAPFLGGAVLNDFGTVWSAPGINNNEARHHFGLNTCNGCHSIETNTVFLQIAPRSFGSEAQLSGFLTGTTVFDPITGQQRTFNDLGRRRADLKAQVCPPDPNPPSPTGMGGRPGTGGTTGMGGRPGTGGTTGMTGAGGAGGKGALGTSALPLPAMPIGTLTKGIGRVH
jgi:hypothetical protein